MVSKVLKRDGREEDFQVEKLKASVEKAAREAGYPDDRVFEVVEEVSSYIMENVQNLERADTQSMRTLILNHLDELYPEVSAAWRKYDREVKGRTD